MAPDPHEAPATDVDNQGSTVFVQLVGGPNCEEAKKFRDLEHARAQLIINTKGKRSVIPNQHIFQNPEGVNLKFSVIDSTLRHAFRLTVIIENPSSDIDTPDLQGEIYFYLCRFLKQGDQVQNLQITEIRKANASSSDPNDDDVTAINLK